MPTRNVSSIPVESVLPTKPEDVASGVTERFWQRVRVHWQADGGWHPVLSCDRDMPADELVAMLRTANSPRWPDI
jgi:hypothetical protein